MIIGIDISSIPYGTGVSNYTLNLVHHLLKLDPINHYKLFFSSLRQPLPPEITSLKSKKNVTIYHYRLPPTFLEFVWHRLRAFPIEMFIGICDVFHTWDWLLPPTQNARLITTVNDLVPFLYPRWQHPTTVGVYQRRWQLTPKAVAHYICISEATRTDLLNLFGAINPSHTSVIYDAPEEKYFAFNKLTQAQQKAKIAQLKKIYGLSHFVLAQGTREPRKNLNRLISAFINFKKKHPDTQIELAITGKYGWGSDITHPQHKYLKILGYIPEKDMVTLHASAACLAYPSLYEGFGLPLVKSMAVGTPVLTSNVSCMPEIMGNAGVLVNPKSVSSITQGFEKILHNYSLRRQLISKGLAQASKFHWDITARATLEVYKKVNMLPKIK
ncbi:MAG: glycosyltransferase family 1 protein [Candidatus Shapirobacteria bacterium]